jgi:hypothetical protein
LADDQDIQARFALELDVAVRRGTEVEFGLKSGFVAWLIAQRVIAPRPTGRILLYFVDGRPIHAAALDGDRARSKWGDGCVWSHGPLELPTSYGAKLIRFARADAAGVFKEAALDFYAAWRHGKATLT